MNPTGAHVEAFRPGSLSVVLGGAARISSEHGQGLIVIYGAVILGMALTLVIAFLVLRAAGGMVRFMGPRGIDATARDNETGGR